MRLGVHVALVLVAAVVCAAAIGTVLWWLLGRPPLRQASGWTATNSFEFGKIVLALIGGLGAVVVLVIAYRKQHLGEMAEQREDIKLFAERFTKASDQLGSDKAPVRLAGMYALEGLAQGTSSQRQTIVNVLCAYLRMPYDLPAPSENATSEETAEAASGAQSLAPAGHANPATVEGLNQELQARLTAQRILADHLRPGSRPRRSVSTYWGDSETDIDIDLTGATLIDFNLRDCRIGTARFGGATFRGDASFAWATFNRAEFGEATFTGDAEFTRATFRGNAEFGGAVFSGIAGFVWATFAADAGFAWASFSRAEFGKVRFDGVARFGRATFSEDAEFGGTTFTSDAEFAWATFGRLAWFSGAMFGRNAGFAGVGFTGDAGFAGATFNRDAEFFGATFAADAGFGRAIFTGVAAFGRATFGGGVGFAGATFTQLPMCAEARVRLDVDPSSKRNWPRVLVVVEAASDEEARLPDRNGKWGHLEAVPDEVPPVAEALE